jgi:hypothetical protein
MNFRFHREDFPSMPLRAKTIAAALALTVSLAAAATTAQAQGAGVNIGRLECVVEGGIGLIITSKKQMQCLYKSTTGREESYFGNIRKFGLDIGVTGEAYMIWGVFAPGIVDEGALAGEYVGGSAEATAGVGAGANALVGGGNITLQPLSVQVQTGLNAALGVSSMTLEPAE